MKSPWLVMTLVLAWAAGCVQLGPAPDPSRFFALMAVAAPEATSANSVLPARRLLGIGPISWPAYLDREELVVRMTETRMAVLETDRWIEPLQENFTRVLAQNLSALLPGERIVRYPWRGGQSPLYQLEIEIFRFEPNSAQDVELSARWILIDTKTRQPRTLKDSQFTRSATGRSTEARVAAMSAVLGEFSREIAAAARNLDGPSQAP